MLTLYRKLLNIRAYAATDHKNMRLELSKAAHDRAALRSAHGTVQRCARTKPACWAASSLLNQTSATVRL